MNLYEILGVLKGATKGQIRKAYRAKASKHHPDRGGNTEDFQKVQNAYMILIDEKRREHYDKTGHAGRNHEPSITDKAYSDLGALCHMILTQNIDSIEFIDVIGSIRAQIDGVRPDLAQKRTQLSKSRSQWEKAQKRAERHKSDVPDIIGNIINTEIMGIERRLSELDERGKVLDKMMELVADYDYRFDVVPTPTQSPDVLHIPPINFKF